MKKKHLKNLVLLLALFLILYIENGYIGGIKITLIWKGVLAVYILFRLLNAKITSITSVSAVGLFFVVKTLIIDYSVTVGFESEMIYAFKTLTFLLLIEFFVFISKNNSNLLNDLAIKLSCGLILVCVPFLLGIIEAPVNNEQFSLAKFGYSNMFEFVGSFGGKHNAAVTLAIALIVLISNIMQLNTSKYKSTLILISLIGCIVLYKTYVRTGYLAFFCGITVIYFSIGNIRAKLSKVPVLLIAFIICYFVFQSSEILQMRMLDKSIYDDVGQLGSGRLMFYTIGLLSYMESSLLQILIGVGDGKAKEIMASYVGHGYASHSGILDILRISGLIGIVIFTKLMHSILTLIRKNSLEKSSTLAAIFTAYLSIMAIQGGYYFWMMVLFSMYIAKAFVELTAKESNCINSSLGMERDHNI